MISAREYSRLLGYPRGKPLEGDVLQRADEARAWFEVHARPQVLVRHGVAVITAGADVDAEIARRWRENRVDEAYFLDRFAAGVVEHLARTVGVSPGPSGWDVTRHRVLMEAFGSRAPVELLPSGMLAPVHSMVAEVTGSSATCKTCNATCDFRRSA